MAKKENEIKVISALDVNKGTIQFEGDSTVYKLADAVLQKVDFEKYAIRKGSTVEVGINQGFVNFLKKIKKPENESQTSSPVPEGMKCYILQAVAANKKVVKFSDYNPENWVAVSEALQKEDFATLGLVAKATVAVKFETIDGKETIVEMKAQKQAEKAGTSSSGYSGKKKWNNYNSGDNEARQTSIEAQAATNSACAIVARVAATIQPPPAASKISEMVRAIAEENYKLIQDLKKRG